MTPGGAAKYQQRWLVYLDILGYREMVREAIARRRITQLIAELRETVGETMGLLARQGQFHLSRDTDAKVLADAIYLTTAPSDRGGLRALTSAASVALLLAMRGTFVRGGMARGGHYDDDVVLFSPALIAAHEEETKAIFPRVVVPDSLMRALDSQRGYGLDPDEFIRHDADGVRFVHYLRFLCYYDERSDEPEGELLRTYVARHKIEIEHRWRAAPRTERVAAKYEWLARYHNGFCHEVLPPEAVPYYEVDLRGVC